MDRATLWWNLYLENSTYARHHETLRHQSTALVVTISGAVVTIVGWTKQGDNPVTPNEWVFGAFLMLLGVLGALFSFKQYERAELHLAYARMYRRMLGGGRVEDKWQPGVVHGAQLASLGRLTRAQHREEFPWPFMINVPLYGMWLSVNAVVFALGVLIVVFANKLEGYLTVGSVFVVLLVILGWTTQRNAKKEHDRHSADSGVPGQAAG